MSVTNDFVSQDPRVYTFKLGRSVASSLSGFLAGAVVASIVWMAIIIMGKV